MVALKSAAQIDSFLAKPTQPVVLVFGPDSGLVRERAQMLIKASVDDVNDPFSLARLDGDELASEPSRLVEEANTVPLFGGECLEFGDPAESAWPLAPVDSAAPAANNAVVQVARG